MKHEESQFVKGVPRSFLRIALIRLAMTTVLALAVTLTLWGFFFRLKPVTRQLQEKTTLMTELGKEVEQLQLKWDPLDADRTEKEFATARQQLFAGPAEVDQWRSAMASQELALALEANIRLGRLQHLPQTNQELAILPATLTLDLASAARQTNSPYHQLLLFLRSLESTNKRIDLVELAVNGTSNSVEQARAVVHLWSNEREKQ